MFEVDAVSKTFRAPAGGAEVHALREVSLRIAAGEFVAVVGASGSGKSTLLHALGGLSVPTSGTVRLDGADLFQLSTEARAALRRKAVGYVFQTFNLVPYLSCLENVMLPALLSGAPRAEARARAAPLLERLGLAARQSHRPVQLSVGERQRVGIARAVLNGPRVLLADEPTGNLDPATADEVMGLLRTLNGEGLTVVMVTHDPRLSAQAGRVVRLAAGALLAPTPPEALAS